MIRRERELGRGRYLEAKRQRPLIAKSAWLRRSRAAANLARLRHDRLSKARRNGTRSLSLTRALGDNSGTKQKDRPKADYRA
jgi:hypothetical protein